MKITCKPQGEKIAERSLEWLIRAYHREPDDKKQEFDAFVQNYFEAIVENPEKVRDYIKRYELYKEG